MEPTMNFQAIDNIISLLQIILRKESKEPYTIGHDGAYYLLGQTLRQLWIPPQKMYLSIEADKKYKELMIPEEEVFNYFYHMKVRSRSSLPVRVALYKGASRTSYQTDTLLKEGFFLQREVFHDDHIIPLKLIEDKLLDLNNPCRENVMEIISDISICRMLKAEDRNAPRFKRPYDEKKIIEETYLNRGIKIKNYNYPKEKI